MNLKKPFWKFRLSKPIVGLAIQFFCLTSALSATEYQVEQKKEEITPYQNLQLKNLGKISLRLGYEIDILQDRKLVSKKNSEFYDFTKSKGFIHGPKLSFDAHPLSAYIKLGKASFSSKEFGRSNFKGYAVGLGGKFVAYDEDDFNVAVELNYSGSRASNKIFEEAHDYSANDQGNLISSNLYVGGKLNLNSRNIDMQGYRYSKGAYSNDSGQIVDAEGKIIGEKGEENQIFFYKNAADNYEDLESAKNYSYDRNCSASMKNNTLEARVVAGKKMGNFFPYVGLGYTQDHTTIQLKEGYTSLESGNSTIHQSGKIRAKNKNKIGPFVGFNIIQNEKLNIGFESQFISRNSLSFFGSYCF